MTKKKYYAIKNIGIFDSWESCQEQLKLHPSEKYKSFCSIEEAQAFLDDKDYVYDNLIKPKLDSSTVVCFCDGSYDEKLKKYSSGVLIITEEGNVKLNSLGCNPKYIEYRNIVGEMQGVIIAVDWAWKRDYKKIVIYHDYLGLSCWIDGTWECSKDISKIYKQIINDRADLIQIEFIKVKGHSNNKYNDTADKLAKNALFDGSILRPNDNINAIFIKGINISVYQNIIELLSNNFTIQVIDSTNVVVASKDKLCKVSHVNDKCIIKSVDQKIYNEVLELIYKILNK